MIVAATRIALDLDLFNRIKTHGSPVSSSALAKESGGEELLISRLLKLLASQGVVAEVSADLWASTPLTNVMTNDGVAAGHRTMWDLITSSFVKAPKFLRETGYKTPNDPHDGFVQYAFQSKQDVWGIINTMPSLLRDFNAFMGNVGGSRKWWYDWFPVEENLLAGYDPSTPLLIDVAGGKGHDIQAFHNKFPGKGRLILQDIPQVIENITPGYLDPAIEAQTYDFFTPQPVHGARAYFLHHILHDWPDEHCLRILKNLRDAMRPGYSKLLIHDMIVPEVGATSNHCVFDLTMMTIGGLERSASQWRALLGKAGFEVVKVWIDDADSDGVVEAVVKE